jgi:hypothetical protein
MIGFVPLDDFERHSPPEHLRLEIRGMKLPRRCLPNAKPAFAANLRECLVIRQRLADAFIQLDKALVGEPFIIHRVSPCKNTSNPLRFLRPCFGPFQQICAVPLIGQVKPDKAIPVIPAVEEGYDV